VKIVCKNLDRAVTFCSRFVNRCFTWVDGTPKLSGVPPSKHSSAPWLILLAVSFALTGTPLAAQEPSPDAASSQKTQPAGPKHTEGKPGETKPGETKPGETKSPAEAKASELPAQIELLATRVRFEVNGDSRKEVYARVHINNELGVRQFARLNFDYNRSFQQVELPLMRMTHASGGTAEILPSAISDQPNPAVVNFPAYHDVRVKSVRILGLEPGDVLEYRVVTTTTHHPLAPDFWLDHTFDRSGVVSQEIFELNLPAARSTGVRISPATPYVSIDKNGEGETARTIYRWEQKSSAIQGNQAPDAEPDVVISTQVWEPLSIKLDEKLTPGAKPLETITNYEKSMNELGRRHSAVPGLAAKAAALTEASPSKLGKLEAIYDFVSQKIRTVDLSLGATGFVARSATEILRSGYATPEDKYVLLAGLAAAVKLDATAALTGYCNKQGLARPSAFKHLLVSVSDGKQVFWLDPSLEVAPFGLIPPSSGSCAFVLNRDFYALNSSGHEWQPVNFQPLFSSTQRVNINASLAADGTLNAKVQYAMRGDNELLLRLAFHQAPKEKWKEVAQLLALSDGFRGKVTNVSTSDPYATKDPFTVEYEITQPKFVDWTKKTVHIPALLPLVALPDPPMKAEAGAGPSAIELGTPLDVQTQVTLHVPPDTGVSAPAGRSVARDYATFASEYSAHDLTLTAERHIKFLHSEVPADHAEDYAAFVRSVKNDEAQEFTLERGESQATTQRARALKSELAKP
jgi:Domain of Unknown Function with PDB structure (DUF3857)